MRLSPHFRLAEFACRCQQPECNAPSRPVPALVDALQSLRERVGQPLVVTSGLRCDPQNRWVGGTTDSAHLTGEGVDIACPSSLDRERLLTAIYQSGLFTGKGIGPHFVHVDVRRRVPVTWTYFTAKGATQTP